MRFALFLSFSIFISFVSHISGETWKISEKNVTSNLVGALNSPTFSQPVSEKRSAQNVQPYVYNYQDYPYGYNNYDLNNKCSYVNGKVKCSKIRRVETDSYGSGHSHSLHGWGSAPQATGSGWGWSQEHEHDDEGSGKDLIGLLGLLGLKGLKGLKVFLPFILPLIPFLPIIIPLAALLLPLAALAAVLGPPLALLALALFIPVPVVVIPPGRRGLKRDFSDGTSGVQIPENLEECVERVSCQVQKQFGEDGVAIFKRMADFLPKNHNELATRVKRGLDTSNEEKKKECESFKCTTLDEWVSPRKKAAKTG